MRQIFLSRRSMDSEKRLARLEGSAFHHLVHVLRKKNGDVLEAFDGQGTVYRVRVERVAKDHAELIIEELHTAGQEGNAHLVLATGILKGKKMHWLVQKLTELGVHAIAPLVTRRTISQPGERGPDKAAKWNKIAVEAAKQCGRASVPNILHPVKLEDFWSQAGDFDAKLVAWEGLADGATVSLKEWVMEMVAVGKNLARPLSVLLMVGPEGGFDTAEVELAKQHGFIPFGLGKNILRSETAALIASAIVAYELENMHK